MLQLEIIQNNLEDKSNNIVKNVNNIPVLEKNLRAIQRNQQIKESLYLFLLQKGEEAQVSYAVTEPSIKVVEYAISNPSPLAPKTNFIYLVSIIIGLFIPFIALFLIFLFDNNIQSKEDIEKFNLNVIGEIPYLDMEENEKVFINSEDRTIVSEAFRMLMSNVRYLENQKTKNNLLTVTSSIKSEGKTLTALNLALSFASIGKKTIIVGCDLRNPQIHRYLDVDKNVNGLVDYLVDNKNDWQKNILRPFENQNLDVLLSGPIPPNPLNLINNGNIDLFIKEARKIYEYVIIDTAPTLLVADSKSLINKSDIVIYLVRCNQTNKELVKHISNLSNDSEANFGVVLNGIGQKNSYGYTYGYRYGYGYSYKYAYNYGYGYGYSSDDEKS